MNLPFPLGAEFLSAIATTIFVSFSEKLRLRPGNATEAIFTGFSNAASSTQPRFHRKKLISHCAHEKFMEPTGVYFKVILFVLYSWPILFLAQSRIVLFMNLRKLFVGAALCCLLLPGIVLPHNK